MAAMPVTRVRLPMDLQPIRTNFPSCFSRRRRRLISTFVAVGTILSVALTACADAPPTAPATKGNATAAVPFSSVISESAPIARTMSSSTPDGGEASASHPVSTAPQGSAPVNSSTAAAAPAMRMLWQNTSTGDRSIWLMNGTSWDGSYVLLPHVPTAWLIAGSGDFNGDGEADIVWQNTTTGDRSIWLMSGTTWSGSYVLLPQVPIEWSIAAVADFNADGDPDLVWQNTTNGDRSIWFMNGSTYEGSYALLQQVETSWSIAAAADFNADGKPDLVWQNLRTGQRSIWFMNGSTWSGNYALLQLVSPEWRIAAAADFDGDAKPDLVWQHLINGERSIWLMNGSVWSGSYALLPTVPPEWRIAGVLNSPSTGSAGSWVQLGADVSGISAVALASDGISLYRFYCKPVEIRDEGKVEQWNGTGWTAIASLTNECHDPDIEVEGSLWVAGFETDRPDYGWASNANGGWVLFQGTFLVHQWGIHVAIAQGRPYGAFAARYSDGAAYPYMMLHVISHIPAGNKSTLNGGWGGVAGYDIATNLGMGGDRSAWYTATRQVDWLWVKKGYHNGTSSVQQLLGDGFNGGSPDPVNPEVVVHNGAPTVVWLERVQKEIWVAQFSGTRWVGLGSGGVTNGYIGHARADTYQSNLYVLQVNSAESPRLGVNQWNGLDWAALPDPLGSGEVPSSVTGDIAVLSNGPVVAYVAGGVLKVKQLRP
jgi:hypothetical protein